MGKGSSSPPAAPDPVATAQAQTQSNEQTAAYQQGLNLINQVTPYGTLTYTMTSPGSGNAPPQYTATTALSPEGQQAFNLSQQVSTALQNLALQGTGLASNALSTPMDLSNLPSIPSSLGALPTVDLSSLPSAPTSLDLSGTTPLTGINTSELSPLPSGLDTSGLGQLSGIDTSKISALPQGLDLSSLGAMPQADEAARQNAQDAFYGQETSMLDPQYAQEQTQLQTQLINSGIPQGSAAYNNAMDNFQRNKTAAYQSAQNSAITNAANYESTLLNNALNVRQEGVNEQQQQLNTAQESLADALGISNAGLQQQQAEAGINLANNQQQTNQAQDIFSAETQAAQNDLANQLSVGNYALNTAQAQAGQAQSANQTDFNEEAYLQNLPINQVTALEGAGQIGAPQFTNTPQTGVANTDTAAITQNAYNAQLQAWEQQQQQAQQSQSSMFSGIAAVGSAALMAF